MSRGMIVVQAAARPILPRHVEVSWCKYEPAPRWSHSTALVGDKVFLWGGLQKNLPVVSCDGPEKEQFTSLVDVFHLRNGCWQQRKTRGKPPRGVINYSSSVIGKRIFYFGGHCGHSECFHNSITTLDTEKMVWEEIKSEGKVPMQKNSCGMVSFQDGGDDFLFLVGGVGKFPSSQPPQFKYTPWNGSSVCGRTNEQHIFSLQAGQWTIPSVTGASPPPCTGFSFTSVSGNRAAMFGGYQPCQLKGQEYVSDVYVAELSRHCVHWSRLTSGVAHWPSGRSRHAACCMTGPQLLVVGGTDDGMRTLSDCWLMDVDTAMWNQIQLPESVTGRQWHAVSAFFLNPNYVWLVVFGGVRKWQNGKTYAMQGMVAETAVVELVSAGGKWSVGQVFTRDTLGSQHYLQKLLDQVLASPQLGAIQQTATKPEEASLKLKSAIQSADANHRQPRELLGQLEEARRSIQWGEERADILRIQLEEERRQAQEERRQAQEERRQAWEERRHLQEQLEEQRRYRQEAEREVSRLRMQVMEATRNEVREKQSGSEIWMIKREEVAMTSEVVGTGGWGEVKVAMFRGLRVVAKILHGALISEFNLQHFHREMSMAAIVRHPNLLQFIGAVTEGTPIILTELMPTNLRTQLERARLPRKQILSISQDLSLALNYLHLFRPDPIIHRDISSSNVLLEPTPTGWRAKVSDFGSANFRSRATTAGPGNPVYSAPESRFPDDHSPKMDVFSFGVLLIEMVLYQPPGTTTIEKNRQVSEIQWAAMSSLIRHCLSQSPFERPNMEYVLTALRNMMSGPP